MTKGRLEAFSDGVIAILITIMVLELKQPEGSDWGSLHKVVPTLLFYLLSFVFVAIYWNNHHHMLHATGSVNGVILWANMHLLFWLSLVPFVTSWMGEHPRAHVPTAVYGIVLLGSAISYFVLSKLIIAHEGPDSVLRNAIGGDTKGIVSLVVYMVAIASAFANTRIAQALFVLVAVLWFVPDRRIERTLRTRP